MSRVGRPRKYEGRETKLEGFALPLDLCYQIENESKLEGVSKSEYVVRALESINKSFVREMISIQKELKETISIYSKSNTAQKEQIDKLMSKISSGDIYKSAELDNKLLDYFVINKDKIRKLSKGYSKKELTDNIVLSYRRHIFKLNKEDINVKVLKKQIELILVGYGYIKGVIWMRLIKTLSFPPEVYNKIDKKFKGDNFSKYVMDLICEDLKIKTK